MLHGSQPGFEQGSLQHERHRHSSRQGRSHHDRFHCFIYLCSYQCSSRARRFALFDEICFTSTTLILLLGITRHNPARIGELSVWIQTNLSISASPTWCILRAAAGDGILYGIYDERGVRSCAESASVTLAGQNAPSQFTARDFIGAGHSFGDEGYQTDSAGPLLVALILPELLAGGLRG